MRRLERKGFTLLELIVALSLSVFVLIGIISLATTMISYQLDATRKVSTEGGALAAQTSLLRDVRATSYMRCPGRTALTGCTIDSYYTDVLSGCTNWSNKNSGADKRVDPAYVNQSGVDECFASGAGQNVKSYYYCTPDPAADPRLIRYVACGTTCNIPAPAACGSAAAGATMQVVVNAVGPTHAPGFWKMDGVGYYYERADDISGVGMHFIVGVGTPTVAGTAGTAQNNMVPTSYKINTRVGMLKSYNDSED